MSAINYRSDRKITAQEFIDILKRSTLSQRRPINNLQRIEKMICHANILITAWHDDKLVGVSRALSDFSFCCYLSDLAVDEQYQHQGIGRELIRQTHVAAGEGAKLILLAAPAAIHYYPKTGMKHFEHCFVQDYQQIHESSSL